MFKFYKKVISILDGENRRKLHFLLPLTVLLGITQMLGVAVIFPFMSAVLQPEQIQSNPKFQYIYNTLHFTNTHEFLLVFGVIAIIMLVGGNLFSIYMVKKQYAFAASCREKLTGKIYQLFIFAPYDFFMKSNTTELSSVLTKEIYNYCCHVVVPVITIVSNVFSISFIFILLLIMNPAVAISSVVTITSVFFLIYYFMRKKLNLIEMQRYKDQVSENKLVLETLSNSSELKILSIENYFVKLYRTIVGRDSINTASAQIMSAMPRYILEIAIFGMIIAVVLFSLLTSLVGVSHLITGLVVFAFAGYRIMPLVQMIYGSVILIKTNKQSIPTITRYISELSKVPPVNDEKELRDIKFTNSVSFDNVSFSYDGTKNNVLKNINLKIPANHVTAILGSSGSGKTTLIHLLMGLLKASQGEIRVDDEVINEKNKKAWMRKLGFVSQTVCLYDDTLEANIALGIPEKYINQEKLKRACMIAQVHDFIKSLPNGYKTLVGDRGCLLSGGQRQRIAIARALYREPSVIVFDEATSALDHITEDHIVRDVCNLTKMGITVILITHKLELTKKCHYVLSVENGILKPKDLTSTEI